MTNRLHLRAHTHSVGHLLGQPQQEVNRAGTAAAAAAAPWILPRLPARQATLKAPARSCISQFPARRHFPLQAPLMDRSLSVALPLTLPRDATPPLFVTKTNVFLTLLLPCPPQRTRRWSQDCMRARAPLQCAPHMHNRGHFILYQRMRPSAKGCAHPHRSATAPLA